VILLNPIASWVDVVLRIYQNLKQRKIRKENAAVIDLGKALSEKDLSKIEVLVLLSKFRANNPIPICDDLEAELTVNSDSIEFTIDPYKRTFSWEQPLGDGDSLCGSGEYKIENETVLMRYRNHFLLGYSGANRTYINEGVVATIVETGFHESVWSGHQIRLEKMLEWEKVQSASQRMLILGAHLDIVSPSRIHRAISAELEDLRTKIQALYTKSKELGFQWNETEEGVQILYPSHVECDLERAKAHELWQNILLPEIAPYQYQDFKAREKTLAGVLAKIA
jgi:hypothetical protein